MCAGAGGRVTSFAEARRSFHDALLEKALRANEDGIRPNADVTSAAIAKSVFTRLGAEAFGARLSGQIPGNQFAIITRKFIRQVFSRLRHGRRGEWTVNPVTASGRTTIANFKQYRHLVALERAARKDPELSAVLRSGYTLTPDIVVVSLEGERGIHASISCKWTIQSDSTKNARSEGLNLIWNRKSKPAQVAVVTGELLPSRISAIALGTDGIDCVYHFALPELLSAVEELGHGDSLESLKIMIAGKRLKDITHLPLDVAT
ncbi:MAG: restriction endonuclease [Bryobacterales bacterium]|nr:restriction endonuclease [Bryobacterales bacterium]